MTTLMVSTSYPQDTTDWKGLFILRLAEALARREDVDLRLWSPPGPVPLQARLDLQAGEREWLAHLMAEGGIAHLLRSRPISGILAGARLLRHLRRVFRRNDDVSIRHVNWLQNALTLPRDGRPALLTALGTDMQLLRLPMIRLALRRVLRGRPAVICPNAEWMVAPLTAALGDVARVHYVPFGIDPRWYALTRSVQEAAPRRWLVVSRLTRGKLGPLFDWCRPHFEHSSRELHLLGPMQERIDVPDWVHYHGPTTPDQLAEHWFPQACGLLTLSQHAEGRPQVMLEAMAAGLPIIASRIPAHEDMLRHRDTGWLCDSVEGLAEGFRELEPGQANSALGARARDQVRREVGTWDDCAQRYATLYRELLGS